MVKSEREERGRLGLPEKPATKYLLQLDSSMSKCLQYIRVSRVSL